MALSLRRSLVLVALSLVMVIGTAWWENGRAWQTTPPSLKNPIDQREQMIKELQEIKGLLKEQNTLLRGLAKK